MPLTYSLMAALTSARIAEQYLTRGMQPPFSKKKADPERDRKALKERECLGI